MEADIPWWAWLIFPFAALIQIALVWTICRVILWLRTDKDWPLW